MGPGCHLEAAINQFVFNSHDWLIILYSFTSSILFGIWQQVILVGVVTRAIYSKAYFLKLNRQQNPTMCQNAYIFDTLMNHDIPTVMNDT